MQSPLLPYYLGKMSDYFELRGFDRIGEIEKREEHSLSHRLFQYKIQAGMLGSTHYPVEKIFLTHVMHPWQQSCYVSFTFKGERDPRDTTRIQRAEDLHRWLQAHFQKNPKRLSI